MKAMSFIKEVYVKVGIVTLVALVIPALVCWIQSDSILRFFEICFISMLSTAFSVYYLGLSRNERVKITDLVKNKLKQR